MEDNYEETYPLTNLLLSTAVESYVPGFMNVPGHDNGIQRFQGQNMLQIEPTGHNTEQGSVSGSGLTLRMEDIRFGEQGLGLPQANMVGTDVNAAVTGRPGQKRNVPGHDNGIQRFQGQNMLQIEPTGHNTEQGSGSGLPQKRNGEINLAERSKNSRAKKKKEEDDMKVEMQRLQEENKSLRKENKKLKKKQNQSQKKIQQSNAELAKSHKDLDWKNNNIDSLSKSLENFSYLQKQNRRLQADKDLLMQQVNAGTNAKKWVKIPFEDRKLKIEGNVLFIKMT